jgi:hypothetical protein
MNISVQANQFVFLSFTGLTSDWSSIQLLSELISGGSRKF